jgi:hypothetical protein
MRALVIFVFMVLTATVGGQILVSNRVTRLEAIAIASQLRVEMSEEETGKVVEKHGLTNAMALGALTGWSRFYGLADGSDLVLDYRPRPMSTNRWFEAKGVLEKAFIQSNGVHSVSITLTNVPS